MPVEKVSLILIRPFDRVEVDVANFIADQEHLNVDELQRISHGAAVLCTGSKANTGDGCGLLIVETCIGLKWTP